MTAMTRFLLLTVMLVFSVNSVSLAGALPCIDTGAPSQEVTAEMDGMDMPSCHEKSEAKPTGDSNSYAPHCDGVCFCLHALLSGSAVVPDFALISSTVNSETQIFVSDRFSLASPSFLPFRPPSSLI